MKRTPYAGDEMPRRFVQQLRFRCSTTPEAYLSIVNGFWRFAVDYGTRKKLSVKVVQEWLRDVTERLGTFRLVCAYARVVERFLDWMVSNGSLLNHPFAELRKQYSQRAACPIVRGLSSPNPTEALEALRPVPRFGSFLGAVIRDHVTLMKSMGYRYKTEEASLLRFDRFLQTRPALSGQPIKILVREWAMVSTAASHPILCQRVGRAVSKMLNRLDPNIAVMRCDRRLAEQTSKLRRAHIYTEDEVRRLLEVARNLPSPKSPLRPLTLYTMLVLAYCAGLRLGELVRLNIGDIDFRDGTIDVRDSKFFKSRRLPLASSVMAALRNYLAAREQAGGPKDVSSGLFWHIQSPGRYSRVTANILLVRALRTAGLKPAKGRQGARVHDLRHAFVVNRMLAWYREGINPQLRLPYLATYLGHKDITSTLVYLTITEELLQQASERFRVLGARILRASTGGKA